jgi:hypothetical protein
MNPVYLLDDSLQVEAFFSPEDGDLTDNICLKVVESCKEDEKIFIHDESDLFLTAQQARDLAEALLAAVRESEANCK